MRKVIALFVCFMLTISLFSGCCCLSLKRSDIKPAPTATTAPTEQTQETTATTQTTATTAVQTTTAKAPESIRQTTQAATEEPEESGDGDLAAWKSAYLDTLYALTVTERSYSLVHIDNDNIPELYIRGTCEAEGDEVYTYKNGEVLSQHLRRTGGGSYLKYSGILKNTNGNMGYYYTNIYTLDDNDFTEIFSGLQAERIETAENGEYILSYTYSIGDEDVSENEYYAAIDSLFTAEHANRLADFELSYDEIIEQITEF